MDVFRDVESKAKEARRRIVLSQCLARAIVHPSLSAQGDRVSHATCRHPAGQPRKGAIAAGKEGLAIGINYCEWRGLCLPFSLFWKEPERGKNSTPATGCSLSFWKALASKRWLPFEGSWVHNLMYYWQLYLCGLSCNEVITKPILTSSLPSCHFCFLAL